MCEEKNNTYKVQCPQCSAALNVTKADGVYMCPVCAKLIKIRLMQSFVKDDTYEEPDFGLETETEDEVQEECAQQLTVESFISEPEETVPVESVSEEVPMEEIATDATITEAITTEEVAEEASVEEIAAEATPVEEIAVESAKEAEDTIPFGFVDEEEDEDGGEGATEPKRGVAAPIKGKLATLIDNGKKRAKRPKEKIIRSTGEKICHEIVFVVFLVYAITLVYPFIFVLLTSFKNLTPEQWVFFKDNNPFGLPTSFSLNAYGLALERMDIFGMYYNSITLTVGQTFVSMMLTCMAAYVLAKYPFKGSSFLYTFIIVCSIIPTFGAQAATFQLMVDWNLKDTYLGMMLMCGGFGSTFLYVHSFFKGIPWSFAESARIDGASDFRIFLQIMVPLAKNGIMVFAIMRFMGFWNEYWNPLLYYSKHPTIGVALYLMEDEVGQSNGIDLNVFFAGTILCIVPVLILYAFLSDKLMGNLTAGGIKG